MECGSKYETDELDRAIVCVACFHHLLRQWSSYERRCIPLSKRNYKLITDDRVSKFQYKREDEIRKEADSRLKAIKNREEKIRQDAERKLQLYRQREEEIRQEAEQRLSQEHKEQEEIRRETERKLREELKKEEEIKRKVEEEVLEQKQKADYIRQEAERLLREERLSRKAVSESNLCNLEKFGSVSYELEVALDENQRSSSVPELQQYNSGLSHESDSCSTDSDMEYTTVVTQTETGIRLRRSNEDEYSAEARRQRRRERSRSREGKENSKCQKVEYQVVLKSDDTKSLLPDDDTASGKAEKNEYSGELVTTKSEFQFVSNGQGDRELETTKPAINKEDDFDEDDIRRAGEEIKAKFQQGRKVFEKESEEPAKLKANDSSEKRKRDLGRKRAQFLFRGGSDAPTPAPRSQSKTSEPDPKMNETKTKSDSSSLEPKKVAPVPTPRQQPDRTKERLSSLGSENDNIDGVQFPEEDEEAKRRRKKRDERNKRRREGEGVNLRRYSDPKYSTAETRINANLNRLSQPELSSEPFVSPASEGKTFTDEDIVEPEEQQKQETEVSLIDFLPPKEVEEQPPTSQVPGVGEDTALQIQEGGTGKGNIGVVFPASRDEVDSTRLMSFKSPGAQKPEVAEIETAFPSQRKTRAEQQTIEEERKRKKREMEEKRRRIEERQRKAAEQKRRQEKGESVPVAAEKAEVQEENADQRQERRKSLLLMWESMSDQPLQSPRSPESEEEPVEIFKREISRNKRNSSLKREYNKVMNLEEDSEQTAAEITAHKPQTAVASRRWNKNDKARLPSDLNSENLVRDVDQEPGNGAVDEGVGHYLQNNSSGLQLEEERKSFPELNTKENFQEPSYEECRTPNMESTPEVLWRAEDGYEVESDDDKPERRPFYEQDEDHHMTQDEMKWESAGHFQPGKLDTSKFNKFARNDNVDSTTGSLKKGDTSRYELLKKMNRTQSKQEILVPSKLKVDIQGEEDLEEEDSESKFNRPYVVDKLDEALKVQFEKGESYAGENQKHAFEDQRRKNDKEEMERARLEEENRKNSNKQEENKVKEKVYSDEVDKKVKRLNFGKVDVSKWQGHGDGKNAEQSKYSFQEEARKAKLQPKQKKTVHMEQPKEELLQTETPELVEESPAKNELANDGDEYEAKIKQKNINRLDKNTLNFEREERIKREQEEMDFLRQEEIKKHVIANDDPEEKIEDSDEDEYDKKVKKKSIGRLDMENSIFSVTEKRENIAVRPKSQTTQKIALQEEHPKEDLIEEESAPDPVQQAPSESETVEDDYEVKIKQKNINKLDKKAFTFEQTPDDVRWRQLGEDRIKYEQEELEFLRQEEIRRRDIAKNKPEEKVEDSDEDEYDKKVKKKNVGRLDMENSIFSVAEKREESSIKPKSQTTQKIALQEELPREELIEAESAPDPVQQTPTESQPVEDEYEVKIKQRNINRLDKKAFSFEQTSNDVRWRQLGEDRIKYEQEELEFLRQEEIRRRDMAKNDPEEEVEDSDEDEYDKKVKKKNVGRLDMENSIFSVAEKREEISIKPKSQTTRTIALQEEHPREVLIETKSVPDPVQQTPLESEPVEDEYEVKIRQKIINKLDENCLTFRQASDDVRLKQIEEERIKRELDEMELLRQEEMRRHVMANDDREEKVEDSDEDEYDKKVKKKSVGRLDMENSIFSVAEKRENIAVRPKSQKTQKIPVREEHPREDFIEAKSAPDPVEQTQLESEPVEDEYEVKIRQKIINKLDENCLTFRLTSDDVRLKQIEEERIKRELDEMELLRQEEMRRHVMAESEPVESTEDIDEDEYERKVKKKSVGRLNLKSSIFNAADEQEKMFIMSEPKQKITLEKERQREAMIEKEKTVEPAQQNVVEIRPLERTPFEVQLEEEEEYEIKVKQRAVNKLDRNRLNFEKSTDDTKRKQLEKETRRQETEEIQFPKQEEVKRHAFIETKKKHQIEKNPCRGTEVETPSEKFNKEEKPRVGKLNLNWMNVISGETNNDANERPDPALSQQKPEPSPEVDIIAAKQIEDVECTPTMTWYNEDAAFEEKRKNEGVKPLDFSKFVVSTNMDMEERKRRKLELERERQRIEREEIEQQRPEQQRRLLKVTPEDELTFDKNGSQKTSTNFMKESSNASKQSERTSGTNRVESMNGFSEKERESKEIKRQGKIELGIWADIDNSAMVKKQKSPKRNSVVDGKQDVPESLHTRSKRNEIDAELEHEAPVGEYSEERRPCGKLDPGRFATFQRESQLPKSTLIRGKSETRDDSGVQRQLKERTAEKKSRPKSIAVIDTRGLETADQSGPPPKNVLLTGADNSFHANSSIESPSGRARIVKKLDTSSWESRTSKGK